MHETGQVDVEVVLLLLSFLLLLLSVSPLLLLLFESSTRLGSLVTRRVFRWVWLEARTPWLRHSQILYKMEYFKHLHTEA